MRYPAVGKIILLADEQADILDPIPDQVQYVFESLATGALRHREEIESVVQILQRYANQVPGLEKWLSQFKGQKSLDDKSIQKFIKLANDLIFKPIGQDIAMLYLREKHNEENQKVPTLHMLARYPSLTNVLADVPARRGGVPQKGKNLPAPAKRELIKDLYGAIGERFFGMDDATVSHMHQMIDTLMSDRDVEREWDFIQSGNVEKLLMLMHQIHYKADEEDAGDLQEMEKLWQDIAHGIMETKRHNQEISDETWKFVEENLMNFADKFSDKLAKKVKKPKLNPPPRPMLEAPDEDEPVYWEKNKKRAMHNYPEVDAALGAGPFEEPTRDESDDEDAAPVYQDKKVQAGGYKWCPKCVRMTERDENGHCKECGN